MQPARPLRLAGLLHQHREIHQPSRDAHPTPIATRVIQDRPPSTGHTPAPALVVASRPHPSQPRGYRIQILWPIPHRQSFHCKGIEQTERVLTQRPQISLGHVSFACDDCQASLTQRPGLYRVGFIPTRARMIPIGSTSCGTGVPLRMRTSARKRASCMPACYLAPHHRRLQALNRTIRRTWRHPTRPEGKPRPRICAVSARWRRYRARCHALASCTIRHRAPDLAPSFRPVRSFCRARPSCAAPRLACGETRTVRVVQALSAHPSRM
jgi:hypothetical protein